MMGAPERLLHRLDLRRQLRDALAIGLRLTTRVAQLSLELLDARVRGCEVVAVHGQ
jgi:hypothetical protein